MTFDVLRGVYLCFALGVLPVAFAVLCFWMRRRAVPKAPYFTFLGIFAFLAAYTIATTRVPVDLAAFCGVAILPLMFVLLICAASVNQRRWISPFHRVAFAGALTVGFLWVPALFLMMFSSGY